MLVLVRNVGQAIIVGEDENEVKVTFAGYDNQSRIAMIEATGSGYSFVKKLSLGQLLEITTPKGDIVKLSIKSNASWSCSSLRFFVGAEKHVRIDRDEIRKRIEEERKTA